MTLVRKVDWIGAFEKQAGRKPDKEKKPIPTGDPTMYLSSEERKLKREQNARTKPDTTSESI